MGRNLGPLNIKDSYEGLVQISGSQLTDGSGSLITSIIATASYADTATSASYATTASYALNGGGGGTVDTGSLLTTASISNATITFTKGDASTFNIVVDNVSNASTASIATSASFATTASYAANVSTPSLQQVTDTGATTTNTIQVSGSAGVIDLGATDLTYTSGDDTTAQTIFFQNSGFANTANITFDPSSGDLTIGADGVAQFNGNASTADSATSASYALSASLAETANSATSASYATSASLANKSTSVMVGNIAPNTDLELPVAFRSWNPLSGSYYYIHTSAGITYNPTSSRLTLPNISASNATFTSASIGYLQTITGSATIIGDAFILLNTSNATRYAGLLVEDSGSATPVNYTSSWYFDSQLNDWNYSYSSSGGLDYAVALFGPHYSTKGSPTYLTANTIPKAEGTHHLNDSNISDDGSSVTIASNALVSTTGATADLVVTSDDDYTYQSTLRIGGGAGGAGNGFYLTNFNDTSSITTDNGLLSISLGGALQLQGLNYPSTDGNAGEFLSTDGAGNLVFATASAPTTPNLQEVTTIGATTSASIVLTDTSALAYNTIQGNGTGFFIQSGDDSTDLTLAFADSISISTAELRFAPTTGLLSMYGDNGIEIQSATTFTAGTTHTAATVFSSSAVGVVQDITITSSTGSIDFATGNYFRLYLNQNAGADTHIVASNIQAGETVNLEITQDGGDPGTISWGPGFTFVGGTPFAVSTDITAVDVVSMISFDNTSIRVTGLQNFS